MHFSACPCREGPVTRVTSWLCFLSQGPTWASKEKCFTKMYTTSGECCKACNLGEGVVQPCGVNQTVCEPCLDSEYPFPSAKHRKGAGSGSGGDFGDHEHQQVLESPHVVSSLPPGRIAWAQFGLFASIFPCTAQQHPSHGSAPPHTRLPRPPISAPTPGLLPAFPQNIYPANPCHGCSISPCFGNRWYQAPLQIPFPALFPSQWLPGYWLMASVCP